MAKENKVVLHGLWCSTYVKRVELALRIKGIPFEYVEEDVLNKSTLLLKYNPVHKKVPVLVHNGKPVVESLVILEYIDETWRNEPRLLPQDPYERARTRFWAGYVQQLLDSTGKLFNSEDKERYDEACRDVFEKLNVLEEGMKKFLSENPRKVGDESMDVLDIMVVATLGAFRAQEEFLGIKILDPDQHPIMYQWVTTLMELPVVKELTPSHDSLVSFLQRFRQNGLKFSTN